MRTVDTTLGFSVEVFVTGEQDSHSNPATRGCDQPPSREFMNDPPAAEPTRSVTSRDCWRPPGSAISVAGRTLPDGMIYVGSCLGSVNSQRAIEPALIDPSLRVAKTNPSSSGEGMHYWPSYSEISPESRLAYLEWLAAGRRDPSAYIGYVFLFLYGLERRVLHDQGTDSSVKAELPAIAVELEQLLSVYTASGSFQSYAGRLLELIKTQAGANLNPSDVRRLPGRTEELPLTLRAGIGRLAELGQPLPVDWALAWIACDNEIPKRTPVQRCAAEFKTLFAMKYREQYGAGIEVKPCKRQIRVEHKPASGSFGVILCMDIPTPDTTSLVGPRRALTEIVTACADELDPLSRLRTKEPGEQTALRVLSVLPETLVGAYLPSELANKRDAVAQILGTNAMVVATANAVFGDWLAAAEGKPTKTSSIEMIRALHRLGFGVEPDPRFGGPPLDPTGKVVLFRTSMDDPEAPSAVYSIAALFLQLGASVAHSDGELSAAEQQHLCDHLAAALHMSEAERSRLSAHLARMFVEPPDTARLKSRVDALDAHQRSELGRLLVGVAIADGNIDPAEVKNLTKIFRILGLEPASVHEAIHAAQAGLGANELARIPAAGPASADYVIPPATRQADATPSRPTARPLDMAAVEAKIQESAKVAAILAEILAPDEPAAPAATQPSNAPSANCVRTLDEKHSLLLRALAGHASLMRSEYERLAAGVGLMPDGALEAINDLSFSVCDAPLFDGDNPIEIDQSAYQEIMK